MILYHGSFSVIEKPDLSFSRLRTDFGRGFYLTPLKSQAADWSKKFLSQHGTAYISQYNFLSKAGEKLPPEVKILEFDSHTREWLDFVTACRLGKPNDSGWDLVIGGVANDKVFDTLQLYFDNIIGADEAIGRLRFNKPNFQYCFKNQPLMDNYLFFCGSEQIK
ncbi:MAG: DUF3990 domain-containing protein [Treponema sp.]|nr:DUF3990 domain-containing protein [Treponema sp.]